MSLCSLHSVNSRSGMYYCQREPHSLSCLPSLPVFPSPRHLTSWADPTRHLHLLRLLGSGAFCFLCSEVFFPQIIRYLFSHFIQASAQVSAPERSLFWQVYLKYWPHLLYTFPLVPCPKVIINLYPQKCKFNEARNFPVLFTTMYPASKQHLLGIKTQHIISVEWIEDR